MSPASWKSPSYFGECVAMTKKLKAHQAERDYEPLDMFGDAG